jgi:hypothetical protein
MHGPINVKSPNNITELQMGFISAFNGLRIDCKPKCVAILSNKDEYFIYIHFNWIFMFMISNFSTIAEVSRDCGTVPDTVVTVMRALNDGWSYHAKHVEQFAEI